MTETEWQKFWGYEVRATNSPGVKRTRDGRYLLHGKVSDGGKQRTVIRVVESATEREAQAERLAMLEEAKARPTSSKPSFGRYAQSLYERKVALRELKSKKTHERWDGTLRKHLVPAFGRFPVDEITRLDIESWKTRVAKKFGTGTGKLKRGPRAANGWLSILRVILRTAVLDYDMPRDPTLGVKDFDTSESPTYTDENPNSLTPQQTRAFLAKMRVIYPQFYAMTLLGFVTGLRPSTLRPLRRRGPECDVLWDKDTILVRRSNSIGQEVMRTTKTDLKYRLGLPKSVLRVLQDHADSLKGRRAESELLFPSKRAGFMARSALDKPFARVSKAIHLPFTLSPRGMRRTFQDLCRASKVHKDLRKAICGHATDEMSELYQTIRPDEMAKAVGKIAASVAA